VWLRRPLNNLRKLCPGT